MLLYNITYNEGEPQSASVFMGSVNLVAVAGSRNFPSIVEYLEAHKDTNDHDPERVKELFDMGMVIGQKFAPLSERVSAMNGRVFFDGVQVNDVVTRKIVDFQEGGEDFMPLVYFMEKIATNPSEHSREHLFRWMTKHDFALASDGDIIAYKGVDKQENTFFSQSSGKAYVNGQLYDGKIPNQPGTVVEMPRSEVTFDPGNGCSSGLHVGNWRYARQFARHSVLRVKVNPRDIVSVPVDSNDEKVRCCRYRVVEPVQFPDKDLLYVGKEVTKRIAKPIPQPGEKKPRARKSDKPKVEAALPRTYEAFKRADFERLGIAELKWLAAEWGVEVAWNAEDGMSRTQRFAYKLDYAARGRRSKNAQVTNRPEE